MFQRHHNHNVLWPSVTKKIPSNKVTNSLISINGLCSVTNPYKVHLKRKTLPLCLPGWCSFCCCIESISLPFAIDCQSVSSKCTGYITNSRTMSASPCSAGSTSAVSPAANASGWRSRNARTAPSGGMSRTKSTDRTYGPLLWTDLG